ncbi:MAG: hypothetical protein A3I91_05660 [Candidatus Kerfeldbacteria bacterium RIFCSPLOWO2_02_FULL_42_19]|uniref:Glycosyl transferase family 1 domain-containing protein n=2 Tax=Bacteria TaxID=2 RepID=A0A1F4RP32_UNCSA|nr:MAG: hypothetical protein A3F86_04135 [candidate division WOR-1 bacterium RIFCSPLOWO2_12_FULL_45_9]OGY82321.1 MAG: hypothetical protein A3E60_03860 [Candidatus Kerfeldbacteria bacterium RIFCSPHIGHO2_12_FULL_42_13]OGY84750.1 MAG: hypothetical protein A3I91_05660 [Candidatus Kerfeldbacteria bacterium RIFCSPLOWO2_02_FULL_42_19]
MKGKRAIIKPVEELCVALFYSKTVMSEKKLRYPHLIFIFPLFNGPYGGERHCLRLTSALAEKGLTVSICTLDFPKSLTTFLHSKVQLMEGVFPHIDNHNLKTLASIFWMRKLAHVLYTTYPQNTKQSTNICLIGMGWQSVLCLHILRKYFSKRIYFCLEPPRFLYDLRASGNFGAKASSIILGHVLRSWDKKAVRSTPIILANSARTQHDVQNLYHRESSVLIPGIETERFQYWSKAEAKQKLNVGNGTIYISVGKLHKRKRIDKAIQLFIDRETQSQQQNYGRFYIIGTGPEKTALQYLVEKLKKTCENKAVENIFFLGELDDKTVALYMRAADYFIFTAQNEPFGLVIQEAKAAGCTILPHDIQLPLCTWEEACEQFLKLLNEKMKLFPE